MSSITETYFPHLLEILQRDPSAAERLKLDCGMCFEEMTTDGVEGCELPDGELGVAHVAYILLCGHIFGLSCIARHRQHTFDEQVYGRSHHKCPTCRQRQHFIPCGCPHILGTMLQVQEANRQEMLDNIEKVKGMGDRCISCGLKSFSSALTEEVDPLGGVDAEDGDWNDPWTGFQLVIRMNFLKRPEDLHWRLDAFRIKNRLYAPSDISADTRRRLDDYIDEMSPVFFANILESGEGVHRILAEITKTGDRVSTLLSHL
ncbi:hypothetical protein ACHAPO_007650 [Fusarium lateritium]